VTGGYTSAMLVLLLACAGSPSESAADTDATDLDMQADDFPCLTTMESTGRYRFVNLLGDQDDTRAVAESATGGVFPVGTLIQLVPGEAMVKRRAGFDATTLDWEFFALGISAEGTTITTRGGAEVQNAFGGSCFDCHVAAEPQWDLVCGADHGCVALGITQDTIQAMQAGDPRCP
jgi:hypothetical protein